MLSLSLAATGVSVAANVTDSVRFEQYLQSRTLALGTVSNTYIKTASVGRYPEGFAEESYNGAEGVIQGADTTLTVSGNVRAYWVQDSDQHAWSSLEYVPLDLRGKSLRWTSDMSRVGCACNAALYLVAMPPRGHGDASGYCDIQGSGKGECLEIDLLEGNKKAIQTTLHTQTGKSSDGTCNQYGCAVNWGKDDQSHYGLGSMIDSGRPYELDAAFDDDGHMTVRIQQDGVWHDYWDVHSAGNGRKGVPEEASKAVADAMGRGLVLTVSLWEAKDNMAWLNGECNNQYPHCDLSAADVAFSDIRVIGNTPPSPSPSPSPPTPPPTPGPGPSPGCALYPSSDCQGNDLLDKPAQTPEQCCAMCTNRTGCTAFVHKGHDQWNGPTCYMKTSCPKRTSADSILTAGLIGTPVPPPPPPAPSCMQYPASDCFGHDLSHQSAATPGECCAICLKTKGCKAFSHKSQDKWTGPMCYMKTDCSDRRSADAVVTAGIVIANVSAQGAAAR